MGEERVALLPQEILPLTEIQASLVSQTGKNPPANARDLNLIPGLGRSTGGEGMAIHSSVLAWRILKDRGASQATVHETAKSQT